MSSERHISSSDEVCCESDSTPRALTDSEPCQNMCHSYVSLSNEDSSSVGHFPDDTDSVSTPEEERFKELFTSCDVDGDGFIDSDGLTMMCKLLNMEESAEELMVQLGMNNDSKISIEEFLNCRACLMGEIEALTSAMKNQSLYASTDNNEMSPMTPSTDPSFSAMTSAVRNVKWPTMSSSFASDGKQESWEFDSGARDLSPEPNTLQKLIEAAGGNISSGSNTNLLDLANKLHLAALASLKGEISELSTRLQHLSQDRDLLEKQLTQAQLDRIELTKISEERLDEQAQRYEERITELHGVIAELSKKLNFRNNQVIREEDEESHQSDEIASQHSELTSNDNNANESCSERDDGNPELCQLVSELHLSIQKKAAMESSQSTITDLRSEAVQSSSLQVCLVNTDSNSCSLIHQLQDEVRSMKIENGQLHDQLTSHQIELGQAREFVINLRDEHDKLRHRNQDLQSKLQTCYQGSADMKHNSSSSPAKSKNNERSPTPKDDQSLVAKMAERVKLRKMDCGDRHILGSEISTVGISSTNIAEHLVQHLHEESNAQEILQAICASGCNIPASQVKEFEIEVERLNSKIGYLKSQNDLLGLTLEESCTQCDRLSVLIGKYESNFTASQLALNYTDQCIETFDVLVGLLESEQGVLLANCRAAGLGGLVKGFAGESQEEMTLLLKKAHESRKSAENLARHMLQRLDRNSTAIYGVCGGLSNPWDDVSSHNTSSSSTSSSTVDSDFTKGDEQRLREYIHQLKNDRTSVRLTITQLESIYMDPLSHCSSMSTLESQKLDLENAVLMQELMAIKEEKAELKAQVYLYEKEKNAMELRLNTKEAQEQAYQIHIEHLKSENQEKEQNLKRYSELLPKSAKGFSEESSDSCLSNIDFAAILGGIPSDIAEALRREKKLKGRIQDLVNTLEKVNINSELRHRQSNEFVNDLKRANAAIIGAFEKSKKRHQSKLKKIEHQMLAMMERHNNQVKSLKQKLNIKEDVRTVPVPAETTL